MQSCNVKQMMSIEIALYDENNDLTIKYTDIAAISP